MYQRAAMKRRESRDLHARLAELPPVERASALLACFFDRPDMGAIPQLARGICVMEQLAKSLPRDEQDVVASLFARSAAELMSPSARH
jgi:hypothetical protein